MEEIVLNIIPMELLPDFRLQVDAVCCENFEALHDSELSINTFSFYTSVSAVFSSKIEGENIDLDSFIKHKRFGTAYQPDYTRKTDDLYNAYLFAQTNPINEANIAKAHGLITQNILHPSQQGNIRTANMYVTTADGKIEYVAATPFEVIPEMEKLYQDIETLTQTILTIDEVFFFAAMIHLVFVKIHPFNDGNGRTGRLLEKWFLAEKLGAKAWFMQSEKAYYTQHQTYYTHLRALGMEYNLLDYTKALPFLLMLTDCLKNNN